MGGGGEDSIQFSGLGIDQIELNLEIAQIGNCWIGIENQLNCESAGLKVGELEWNWIEPNIVFHSDSHAVAAGAADLFFPLLLQLFKQLPQQKPHM